MSEERSLWKGSPSQWLNLGKHSVAIVIGLGIGIGALFAGPFVPLVLLTLLFPLVWALWNYLKVRCQSFELTTERLKITQGVINQHLDEIELYRVKDILMVRPWWMRITGLASLRLETSDRSLPLLVIPAVSDGVVLREELRKQVEIQRDKKRVRETDFDDMGGGESPI